MAVPEINRLKMGKAWLAIVAAIVLNAMTFVVWLVVRVGWAAIQG